MSKPLSGLKVLDFTTLLPGPLSTLMLAQAGAEVVKVERPGGEDMRRFPPFTKGEPVLYHQLNAGKKVLEVDLKSKDAVQILRSHLETADIVVEQFRPGVMERLGLGYDALSRQYPRLIYCSVTGYGQRGVRAGEAGHDLNYLALTGLLAQSCGTPEHPAVPPAQMADIGGGSFPAVMNILLAVLDRQKTGKGCHIDIAMSDAMFTYGLFAHAEHIAGRKAPEGGTGLLTGGSARYRLYPARCGRMIAVAALEQKFWDVFCDLIELAPEWRADHKTVDETIAAVADKISQKSAEEWRPLLQAANCCVTVVETFEAARADPHFNGRQLFAGRIEAGEAELEAFVSPIAPHFRREPAA
ncbi:CaiB/BaiF CoA-transferase family protein [Roseibium sp. RKSG952]|uniref:CaiB/BaiF CoA transferase family protein n=1 Tax=Roseibium sp. RKSG952 TaxID=2529384 RepID=UPI0012BC49A9|nr:CaiB/BaiF CoA-transferase family protein [Roseibium sp. RKSG952]MTH97149.1 CoA transferase [Roseibium sp. RKSG952]